MPLDAFESPAEVLDTLTAAARAAWGADRLEALRPGLEATAGNLWQIAHQALDVLDDEPDFIGAGGA
jgi:hypothetical protein